MLLFAKDYHRQIEKARANKLNDRMADSGRGRGIFGQKINLLYTVRLQISISKLLMIINMIFV